MQSPPLELVLDLAHMAARNLLRAQGEADFDTISEVTRDAVDRLGDAGPLIFTAALFAGAECFRRHILRQRSAIDSAVRLLDSLNARLAG